MNASTSSGKSRFNPLKVPQIQSTLCSKFYFSNFRQNGAILQQQHLLLILPSIRQTEQIVRKFWIDVYRNGNINMKKLFVEMLESVSK